MTTEEATLRPSGPAQRWFSLRRPALLKLRDWRYAWPFVVIIVIYIIMALVPSWFVGPAALTANLDERLLPPGSVTHGVMHPLGTDDLGRDLLNRLVYGTRVSLSIAFSAVAFAGLAGTALGVLAGTLRGAVGSIIMRVADVVLSIPSARA
jgi:peptide/nickel transport system permease protein